MTILILNEDEKMVRYLLTKLGAIKFVFQSKLESVREFDFAASYVQYPFEIYELIRKYSHLSKDLNFVFFVRYQDKRLFTTLFPRLNFITEYSSKDELLAVAKHSVKRPSLSMREQEVLYSCLRGEAALSACSDLGITTNTFYSHKKRLLKKLGLSSTQQLVMYAINEIFVNN